MTGFSAYPAVLSKIESLSVMGSNDRACFQSGKLQLLSTDYPMDFERNDVIPFPVPGG